jgi:hypothetical protein
VAGKRHQSNFTQRINPKEMALDQHAANLIDTTVKAFNGDVTTISPTDGLSLIDSWISFLQSDDQRNNAIVNGLTELRAELQSGNLDGAAIQRILNDLTKQSTQIVNSADRDDKPKLAVLADALQGFTKQVSGSSKRAKTGGEAPITSTVGGESTNSGAGASALTTNDEDLSDRNGGTIR